MPGQTHQVDDDGDSVSPSFHALRARCGREAPRDATLADRGGGSSSGGGASRPRAASEGFGDRALRADIDPRLTDLVMPDAVPAAVTFGPGGRGGY